MALELLTQFGVDEVCNGNRNWTALGKRFGRSPQWLANQVNRGFYLVRLQRRREVCKLLLYASRSVVCSVSNVLFVEFESLRHNSLQSNSKTAFVPRTELVTSARTQGAATNLNCSLLTIRAQVQEAPNTCSKSAVPRRR